MSNTGASGQGQDSAAQGRQTGQDSAGSTTEGTASQQGTGQDSGQQGGNDGLNLDAITDPALRAQVEASLKRAADANAEAARYRNERNALQAKAEEAQRANETAEQRAQREQQERQQELETLRNELKSVKVDSAFTTAAAQAKALDPGALLALIGGVDKVELDAEGKPSNLNALISSAKTTYPWAFARAAGTEAGAGGPASSGASVNDLIRGSR